MGTPSSLALAAASQRLRGRPGRPRKVLPGQDTGSAEAGASPNSGSDSTRVKY